MGLNCIYPYVNVSRDVFEPSRTSMVEILCENHKESLFKMLGLVLNTSLT